MFKKLNKYIFKNKTNKYIVLGSFTFFLVKGLLWLGVFIFGFNLINFN